jgi:hypothetical protein
MTTAPTVRSSAAESNRQPHPTSYSQHFLSLPVTGGETKVTSQFRRDDVRAEKRCSLHCRCQPYRNACPCMAAARRRARARQRGRLHS